MSSHKNIILVSGANGGIGLEVVRQLMGGASNHLIIGSRSLEKGNAALKDIESQGYPGSAEVLQLDVNSEDSIKVAAAEITKRHGYLNVLINNAAIAWFGPKPTISYGEMMMQTYRTNVVGPYLLSEAVLPLLKSAHGPKRIVHVSSRAGTIAFNTSPTSPAFPFPTTHYSASKCALHMVTVQQDKKLHVDGISVFAVSPGFTISNLGPMNTAEGGAMPTAEGAKEIVAIAAGNRDELHGKLLQDPEKIQSGICEW